jgi:hypothetical protein
MATNFSSADAARARYNQIASGLLADEPGGTRYGHNQIGLGSGGNFSAFDLQYKKGDPSALTKGAGSVANALNSLVSEFGLDTSRIDAPKQGDYEALGSVRYDPGAGVITSPKAAFETIFNKYLKDQYNAKLGGYGTASAPVAAANRAAPVAAPMAYGQPARPTPGAQAVAPVNPGDLGPSMPPADNRPLPPQQNMTPAEPGRLTPGWQPPERRYNDLPTGPSMVNATPIATSGRDPYMEYLAPVYRAAKTGEEAYDEMGLDLMARYGFGAEHNFFPNREKFPI